ncbi:unnamed protein product [Brassica oleracea]
MVYEYALVQLEGLSPCRFCKSQQTRDVKSANILLDENFMAKVSELGLPKTGPYLDQTHVSLTVKGMILKVLCGTPLIDPYISRKKVN